MCRIPTTTIDFTAHALRERRNFVSLTHHPYLVLCGAGKVDKIGVEELTRQWVNILHFFPTFLSRLISHSPTINIQAALTRILYQELGGDIISQSHEELLNEDLRAFGIADSTKDARCLTKSTASLIRWYHRAATNYVDGIGCLAATELVDLRMVAAVGRAMEHISGKRRSVWLAIHVSQEPTHTMCSASALDDAVFRDRLVSRQLLRAMDRTWKLWTVFFDERERLLQHSFTHSSP